MNKREQDLKQAVHEIESAVENGEIEFAIERLQIKSKKLGLKLIDELRRSHTEFPTQFLTEMWRVEQDLIWESK